MKILVCISKAPDTTSKIAFSQGNTVFDENGVQYIVNPYDEWYALVRALEIKETIGGEVTIITVGSANDDAIMRKALAIGADAAVRVWQCRVVNHKHHTFARSLPMLDLFRIHRHIAVNLFGRAVLGDQTCLRIESVHPP